MRALWNRLERWVDANAAGATLALRPGASEAAIARAEATLGVRFPDDLRESFAIHDGQEDEPTLLWLPAVVRLGSLDSIVACWQRDRTTYFDDPQRLEWFDGRDAVRQAHGHPGHVPLAGDMDWMYDRLLVDFIPGPAGRTGQIIVRADIDLAYLCPTFRVLLERTVDGLEAGRIILERRVPELGGELETRYLTPRSKKPMSFYKFFAER